MFTISGIHVIHIHELKKLWPSNHPLCGHFRCYKYLNCRLWRTEYIFVTPFTTSVTRLHRVTTYEHVTDVNNRVLASTRNDVIPSVDASKVYFVASLLTQYWLACKLTCTKRNFDTHQSVTDITAAIGTPWLHKLWLGLVISTGRSSITTFELTSVDWWLCLWPSAKLQPNFGFKMKSCRAWSRPCFTFCIWLVSSYVLDLEPGVYVCTHAHRRSQTSVIVQRRRP